jgi:NAD(P)H-hydrate epimerase
MAQPRLIVGAESLAWLTVAQMREVDRLMTEKLGISLEQMVENAGNELARLTRTLLGGEASGRRVLVLAGPGGNGGGGMVAARRLAAAGADVEVWLSVEPERLAPVPRRQHDILCRIGVPAAFRSSHEPGKVDLVLDALLGYGQDGPPRAETARLIECTAGRRVLALDVPSGLELATGKLHEPHVRAEATLTLALPKLGLDSSAVGDLYLADISVPPAVYERLGINYRSPFGSSPLVRVA